MALEGLDHFLEPRAIGAGELHPITEAGKILLELQHLLPFIAGAEALILAQWRGLDPEPDAGSSEPRPIEFLSRIALASRRDIGVGHHPLGPDGVAAQDVEAERLHASHLRLWEIAVAELVAGIMNLDADRAGVEVGFAGPQALPGMPGAFELAHHLGDASILVDKVVAGDLRLFPGQPVERGVRGLHAGVMQHEHVRHAAVSPRLAVRRRTPERG